MLSLLATASQKRRRRNSPDQPAAEASRPHRRRTRAPTRRPESPPSPQPAAGLLPLPEFGGPLGLGVGRLVVCSSTLTFWVVLLQSDSKVPRSRFHPPPSANPQSRLWNRLCTRILSFPAT